MLPSTELVPKVPVSVILMPCDAIVLSAQPAADFSLGTPPRGCAVAIYLSIFLSLPADRNLAVLSILSVGVFQNGLVGLDRLLEGKP